MTEAERIADQLRRAFEGDAWHGPSVWEILREVRSQKAACRPILGAHTIWEIVLHIATWEAVVRRRLEGEFITMVSPERDWPPVRDASEAAWPNSLELLKRGNQQLREAISRFPSERLDEPVPGMDYTVYTMLHGVVQHALYHAGQIALLNKAS